MSVLELVLGVLVAAGAVALVGLPLWRRSAGTTPVAEDAPAPEETRKGAALLALREIEFDRETGKLSDPDYERLKTAYTAEAVAALRVEEGRAARASDAAETLVATRVLELRAGKGGTASGEGAVCPACGPRPEGDALYCSGCGRSLAGPACGRCGAGIRGDSRFCERCGAPVAGAA